MHETSRGSTGSGILRTHEMRIRSAQGQLTKQPSENVLRISWYSFAEFIHTRSVFGLFASFCAGKYVTNVMYSTAHPFSPPPPYKQSAHKQTRQVKIRNEYQMPNFSRQLSINCPCAQEMHVSCVRNTHFCCSPDFHRTFATQVLWQELATNISKHMRILPAS